MQFFEKKFPSIYFSLCAECDHYFPTSHTFSSYFRAHCTTTAHKTTPIFRGWGRGEGKAKGANGRMRWWRGMMMAQGEPPLLCFNPAQGSSSLPLQKKQETLFFTTSYCCIIMGKCRHVLRREGHLTLPTVCKKNRIKKQCNEKCM